MILPALRTLESLEPSGNVLLAAAVANPDKTNSGAYHCKNAEPDNAHTYHSAVAVGVTAGVSVRVADGYVIGAAPSNPDVVYDCCRLERGYSVSLLFTKRILPTDRNMSTKVIPQVI